MDVWTRLNFKNKQKNNHYPDVYAAVLGVEWEVQKGRIWPCKLIWNKTDMAQDFLNLFYAKHLGT